MGAVPGEGCRSSLIAAAPSRSSLHRQEKQPDAVEDPAVSKPNPFSDKDENKRLEDTRLRLEVSGLHNLNCLSLHIGLGTTNREGRLVIYARDGQI